jgi:hypothetical protein
MSLYLVAGHGAATTPASAAAHLPTARPRRYPSDTSDAEWQIMASYIPAGGTVTGRGGGPVTYPRGLHLLPRPHPHRATSHTTHAAITGEPDDRETGACQDF